MQYLSVGIIYVFEFLITVSFCNRVMDKKMKYSKILVCTFPLYIVAMALYLAFENLAINSIVSFLIFFLTIFIGYKEKIYKQIIYTIYLTMINYISEDIRGCFLFICVFKIYCDYSRKNIQRSAESFAFNKFKNTQLYFCPTACVVD